MSAQTEIPGGVWTHPKTTEQFTRMDGGWVRSSQGDFTFAYTDAHMSACGWTLTPPTRQAPDVESQIEQLKDLISELVDFSCPPNNARCLERYDAALKKAAEVLKG